MTSENKQFITIKNIEIGNTRPVVCVPVMGKTKDEIVSQVKKYTSENAQMIEWRVDAFEKADSMNAIREVLSEIKEMLCNTILLYTYRTKKQGGLGNHDEKTIEDIRMVAAESKVADIIDVELMESRNPSKEMEALKEEGAYTIASHHDFEQTPDIEIIEMILEKMYLAGADIVKIAVMPNCVSDVIELLKATNDFHEKYPNVLLVTMSMGNIGSISRICGEYIGSCITFGAGEKASAPGQIEKDELGIMLDIIHKSLK